MSDTESNRLGTPVMAKWIIRNRDAPFPYQQWIAFPPEAIVQVYNAYGDTRIAPAGSLWWGYDTELGGIGEGVIVKARRLDRPK